MTDAWRPMCDIVPLPFLVTAWLSPPGPADPGDRPHEYWAGSAVMIAVLQ
jgi:hypothetical protein